MNIAVLLTCHNRCKKTQKCLLSLHSALDTFNENCTQTSSFLKIEIFLTDDGCTDNTVKFAKDIFPDTNILHILKGNGSLFWAGGMRLCWKEAAKYHSKWDYYLLLNDDTELMCNMFKELFNTELYSIQKYQQKAIVSGITCNDQSCQHVTYGGNVWINKILAKSRRLEPCGKPQMCDLANANIMLVPSLVIEQIGIFDEFYKHGCADYDYSVKATKKGIPILVTSKYIGICENDHINKKIIASKIIDMNLNERKAYFKSALHSSSDYMHFIYNVSPIRYPLVWIGRALNLYFPKLYYSINGLR